MSEGTGVPAGWYPDPTDGGRQRYWDGAQWTEHVQPLQAPPPPATQPYPVAPGTETTTYYPSQQPQDAGWGNQAQQAYGSVGQQAPPDAAPAVAQKKGMSTGLKVLLVLVVLLFLLVGGCVATIAFVASSDEFQEQLDEIEEGIEQLPTTVQGDGQAVDASGETQDLFADEQSGEDVRGDGPGTRAQPHPYDRSVDITWSTFGDADGSRWATTIGAPRDITDQVLADNQFNDPPPDGIRFVGFDVELTLLEAGKEPLSPGFNFTWELLGGATAAAYDFGTIETESFGCGVHDGSFDDFSEVFVSGTLAGTVCIPLPAEDLGHPDTQVALHFIGDTRVVFGP